MDDVKGQELRDKVICGLACCKQQDGRRSFCEICPYAEDTWRDEGHCACEAFNDADVAVPVQLLEDALAVIEAMEEREPAEGLWLYVPDDRRRAQWKCSKCGKYVHRDPAEKLYCSACGQRNRKEA